MSLRWVRLHLRRVRVAVGLDPLLTADLLYALRAWAAANAGKPPRDTDGGRAFAAHASAVRHMLDLWERGREVPGL